MTGEKVADKVPNSAFNVGDRIRSWDDITADQKQGFQAWGADYGWVIDENGILRKK